MKQYEDMDVMELSDAFAIDFLGWKRDKNKYPEYLDGNYSWPCFALNVDDLLPYLDSRFSVEISNDPMTGEWTVSIADAGMIYSVACEMSLPAAICIAMLNGKKNKQQK